MFKAEAAAMVLVSMRAAETALEFVLAFERFRTTSKDSTRADADYAGYLSQLNELQRAMDEAWARAMTEVRAARKSMGEEVKGKPPEGMFDEKRKSKKKEPAGPPRV